VGGEGLMERDDGCNVNNVQYKSNSDSQKKNNKIVKLKQCDGYQARVRVGK
jgi:hypothetical protein